MSDTSFPSQFSKRLQPPSGQAIETFSDLLADAPDLDGICFVALQFALETIGHSSGVLVAQTAHDQEPAGLAQIDLPGAWIEQMRDSTSPLNSVIQKVLETDTYLIGETASDYQGIIELAAAIPISTRSGVQGVLIVHGPLCSPIEADWLLKLSRPLGRAIRIVRSSQAGQRRTRELVGLQETLSNLGFGANLESMQIQLLRGVRRLLGAEQCALILIEEDRELFTRKALDEQGNWLYQVEPIAGSGLLRECLASRQVIRVNDISADRRFNFSIDPLPGLEARSLLFAPLIVNGYTLGALQAINKLEGQFDDADQEILGLVACLASSAIFGGRLLQRVKIAEADREAGEWELVNARNILNTLLTNLPGQMYIIDRNFELVALNTAMTRRTGQDLNALTGKICYQVLYKRSEACLDCQAFETFKDARETHRTTARLRENKSESYSLWEIHSYPVFDRSKQVVQAILFEQDISDRSELEAIVAQSGKLAALGQLAAGVAHEINNPLTAIIANAQILQRELSPGDERLESVDLIAMAGARAAQVVRNLLDFARKEQAQRILTNVNDTLRASLALVQHELMSRSITLEFHPDDQLPTILVAADSLQGVWLNLLLNAIESIDKTPGVVRVASRRMSDKIQVTIADNGRGISSERLERIFEPFYTTKAPGRGTGLGLSVCSRIIEQHDGKITVESQLGQGTEFLVLLPIS